MICSDTFRCAFEFVYIWLSCADCLTMQHCYHVILCLSDIKFSSSKHQPNHIWNTKLLLMSSSGIHLPQTKASKKPLEQKSLRAHNLNFTGQTLTTTLCRILSGWLINGLQQNFVTRLYWTLVLKTCALDCYCDSVLVMWRLTNSNARYVWTCTVSCFNFARCGVDHHYQRIQVKPIEVV